MDEKELKLFTNENCRICLCKYSGELMSNLYINESEYKYDEIIFEVTKIEIKESDKLSQVICKYCVEQLIQIHNFIVQFKQNDQKLRLALQNRLENGLSNDDKAIINLQIESETEFVNIKTEFDPSVDDFLLKQSEDDDDIHNDGDFICDEDVKDENRSVLKRQKRKREKKINHKDVKCIKKKKNTKRQDKTEKYPKKCPQCGVILSCKSVYLVHYRTHTNERPFKCNECIMTFKAKSTLDVHKRRCHVTDYKKTHTCEECKKSFFCSTELRVHMRSHTGDTPYKCKLCDKQYTQSASLKRHVRSQHTGERPYQCSMCPKNFVTLTEMRKHEVIHSDERKHICDICKFAFKCKATLRIHLATHSKMKRFVCDQCGASFHTKANLTIHQSRRHSEFAGQCIVCNKQYSNLNDHMRTHTGETPFHCGICGKKFSLKASFFIHLQIHQSDKHPCQYQGCNKSYPKLNFLEYHVLKHHKKFTPYVCKYCDKGYFRFCDIKSHMNVNHADKDLSCLKKIKIPPSFFTDTTNIIEQQPV